MERHYSFVVQRGLRLGTILFIVSQKMFFLAFFHSSLILLPIKILGFHVFVGAIALFVSLVRVVFNHFTGTHHFGFESGIWYWHFVDVVWLFLLVTVYWWGGKI